MDKAKIKKRKEKQVENINDEFFSVRFFSSKKKNKRKITNYQKKKK